jgi:hypothetical protein
MLKFDGLESGKGAVFELSFIGVFEGVLWFPKVCVSVEGEENFVVDLNDGILLVGSVSE